jgi:myosin-crossreactive antigen
MDYHLFSNSFKNSKTGKIKKYWYYWYYDQYGKQVKKSCKNCITKKEAEFYIANLPPLASISDLTVQDIASVMYIPGSPHYTRRIQFGKNTS